MKKKLTNNRGFVILFAIIIATMILLIGAGIYTTAFKETVLASAATESQIALFAADTGMECALFHEFVTRVGNAGAGSDVLCAGEPVAEQDGDASVSNPMLYSYDFDFDLESSPACGTVEVNRDIDRAVDTGSGGPTTMMGTEIIARGYNICLGGSPDLQNPTVVERRLEAWYPYPVVADTGDGGGGSDGSDGSDTSGDGGAGSERQTGPLNAG